MLKLINILSIVSLGTNTNPTLHPSCYKTRTQLLFKLYKGILIGLMDPRVERRFQTHKRACKFSQIDTTTRPTDWFLLLLLIGNENFSIKVKEYELLIQYSFVKGHTDG